MTHRTSPPAEKPAASPDFEAKQVAARAAGERIDVVRALGAMVDDLRPLAEARGLLLELTSDVPELPACMDLKLLERIVFHLVGNGLKFTAPDGWVRVGVAWEGEWFRIDVADNGPGIDAEAQARLSHELAQPDAASSRKHEPTGFGLSLVKHFTELLGGSVAVRSMPGRGTTFSVSLPVVAVRAKSAREPLGEKERAEDKLATRGFQRQVAMIATGSSLPPASLESVSPRPRVLVAEDNDDLRAYMLEALGQEFSVLGVADGAQAWERLQSERFDLVLSDVMMPELDGLALIRKIKEHAVLGAVPVILLSPRGGPDAASGLDAGADDYLPKPFATNELRARARAAYRMKHLQEQLREQARVAGVAEVATGIVHNVGNVLNSVGISAGLLQDAIQNSAIKLIEKLSQTLEQHAGDPRQLAQFLNEDAAGKNFAASLALVTRRLLEERAEQLEESRAIIECVSHVREIVSSQQGLTRGFIAREATDVNALMDKALLLSTSLLRGASVDVQCCYEKLPVLWIDPHILLQTFINVLNNARQALTGNPVDGRLLVIRTRVVERNVEIEITDNGEGIAPKHMKRLFQQGFTTKSKGQGFGLHMSALNLRVIGGLISGKSEGPGKGATFIVTLPVETQAHAAE